MNEWLDIMLEEIDRKKSEAAAAREEAMRRLARAGEAAQRGTADVSPVSPESSPEAK